MRIERIILKQVGPFEDAKIDLPPGTDPNLADVYLLTGSNGSGKSTALYAVAEIIRGGDNALGTEFLAGRLRSRSSQAQIECGGIRYGTRLSLYESPHRAVLHEVNGGRELLAAGAVLDHFSSRDDPFAPDRTFWEYCRRAAAFSLDVPEPARPTFSWAAFAYAGMRSITDVHITAIEEPQNSPFENSLSFINTTDTKRLAHWIASQDFKRLKAKENGRRERAAELEQSILDIERVVAEIIDDDFAFVTGDEDNNVRVRRNGAVVDLGLLPDGLKSIVSWVADLLMRLDRIPWVDDTPPMKRSFLLLLDEVDIHLHPSWQRKILPIVQRMFPNAQIIASTHSPFVVASAEDAQVIALQVKDGVASVERTVPGQIGVSYSSVLRSIFGIDSDFDIETEKLFQDFHAARRALLSGDATDPGSAHELAAKLAGRSEEVRELVAIELRQMERQLQQRSAG